MKNPLDFAPQNDYIECIEAEHLPQNIVVSLDESCGRRVPRESRWWVNTGGETGLSTLGAFGEEPKGVPFTAQH